MTFVCPVAKGMDLILSYSAYSITDSGSYHLHDKPRGEGYRFSVCLTLDSTPCLGGRGGAAVGLPDYLVVVFILASLRKQ